jgi:hypothetical protein
MVVAVGVGVATPTPLPPRVSALLLQPLDQHYSDVAGS